MGYFSNFYVESFPRDVPRKFVILFKQIQIHNKHKYLLIVAQDIATFKIVRLIDFHGKAYDLYKYQEDWAKLKKGDIIKVRCTLHESKNFVNVLRVISDFELVDTLNYYDTIKENWKAMYDAPKPPKSILQPEYTDLEYIGKKIKGRYGFVLFSLKHAKLIDCKDKNNKTKYQFSVISEFGQRYYADIVSYVPDIEIRIGDLYTGFVLLQFAYKDGRLRLKVCDFLNEDEAFEEYNPFGECNPFDN